MRKLTLILLGLVGCLLFAAGGTSASSPVARPAAELSIDYASAGQWLCEQTCNSDLNLPRTSGEVSASQASVAVPRGGHSDAGRASLRFAVVGRTLKTQQVTSVYNSNPSAGLHAVDYYVYRLRRLII